MGLLNGTVPSTEKSSIASLERWYAERGSRDMAYRRPLAPPRLVCACGDPARLAGGGQRGMRWLLAQGARLKSRREAVSVSRAVHRRSSQGAADARFTGGLGGSNPPPPTVGWP